ncbi:Protein phosphatase 2C 6 [Rhodotorula kratochvilovae]
MLHCCCTCLPRRTPLLAPLLTRPLSAPPRRAPHRPRPAHHQRRAYSDEQHFRTQHGSIRVNLKAKGAVGFAQSRGERPYQEDAYASTSLALPQSALRWNVVDDRLGTGWAPTIREGFEGEEPPPGEEGTEEGGRRRQVAYFGVFDGHGGDATSKYLSSSLHALIESSTSPAEIPPVIDAYRALGGYLKRYRGGPLDRFRPESDAYVEHKGMALDEMAVLAFLKADNHVVADRDAFPKSGSTATVALLHSLDLPHSYPYYASALLSLTIAHLGDTSALLASSSGGRAHRLTQSHHADSRTESERLRTSGTGIITDSFGESRWGGVVANTRAIGDREFKPVGVIGEPEIVKRVVRGSEWAFLLLCSDGVTDALSDQEIVDLCRGIRDPAQAAKRVVGFAEDVGAEDNLTCLVIPLAGWGRLGGLDSTASRREYRLKGREGAGSGRMKRM